MLEMSRVEPQPHQLLRPAFTLAQPLCVHMVQRRDLCVVQVCKQLKWETGD